MLRYILGFTLAIAITMQSSYLRSQEKERPVLGPEPPDFAAKIEVKKLGFEKPVTILDDVKAAALFLEEEVNSNDRPFIRFFTVCAVPEDLRDDTFLQLSFVCHSLIGISNDPDYGNAGSYYPIARRINAGTKENPEYKVEVYNKVTDTMVWIDIRNFNWSPQSWENMSVEDGYFVKPIIDNDINDYLRLLAGNAVVRADWFIDHSMNTLKQKDTGRKTLIYRELLYSLTEEPKNVKEFEKIWGLPNVDAARDRGNEFLTLTVNKAQVVARHNRILSGYRTDLGWYFRSYDVISETGDRDYVSSFLKWKGKPPTVYDAGELIASNAVHMQVYDLIDDKDNIIEDANAAAARHLTDVLGDVRVRVATSCADCHSGGPIPSENSIKEFLKLRLGGIELTNNKVEYNGELNVYNYADKLRIERAYLSDKFEDFVADTQIWFARALEKINGLTPEDNVKSYNKIIGWYNKPLDMAQVVREVGYEEKEILEKAGGKDLKMHQRRLVPPRLSLLIVNKAQIPREIWESPGRDGIPGHFQQTMIMMKGLTQKKIVYSEVQDRTVYVTIKERRNNTVYLNGKPINPPEVGSQFKYLETVKNDGGEEWFKVEINGAIGYIHPSISNKGT